MTEDWTIPTIEEIRKDPSGSARDYLAWKAVLLREFIAQKVKMYEYFGTPYDPVKDDPWEVRRATDLEAASKNPALPWAQALLDEMARGLRQRNLAHRVALLEEGDALDSVEYAELHHNERVEKFLSDVVVALAMATCPHCHLADGTHKTNVMHRYPDDA